MIQKKIKYKMSEKVYTRDEVLQKTLEYFNGDELAANVWINKYALKDSDGNLYELTPNDMHRRLSKEIARIEKNYPNPMSEDEIFNLLKDFKYIVPQGGPMSGIGNMKQTISLSNCFVIGNDYDSYGSIMLTDQEQVQLMKRRGGVGHDLSHLRPNSSPVKNSALTSTGLVSFMERYSNSTREVGQDGRRGALMLSCSIEHPDSERFMDAKMEAGKITGANVSLRITDNFMKSVISDTTYFQQYPINSNNPTIKREVEAKPIFDKIVHNAWKSAEPGILFWDTIQKESVPDCYPNYKTTSTNPCIVGGSMIATADGRNAVSIEQLSKEGKDVPLYSKSDDGQVQIKWGRNPRKTGNKKEVWKLVMDDGSEFIATPDHTMFLKDNSKIELKELKTGDSLSSFYTHSSNKGYRQISQTGAKMQGGMFRNRRQYRLIYEFFNGLDCDYKNCHIHHVDFDNSNDNIDNLLLMCRNEHTELHADRIRGDKNPYHKMTDEWKLNFASKPGSKNPKYIDVSNDEILTHGKKLYKQEGRISKRLWIEYAKKNNLPQFLSNELRFKTFTDFKNQVVDNHKVVSVEFHGYEDVFNITVDDNHNYIVLTDNEDDKYITSGGICVKNCGEIPLCPYDSCRLLAINLLSYVKNPFTKKSSFDFDLFVTHSKIAQRIMDDIIDLELEKIDQILEKIEIDPEPQYIKDVEIELWAKIREKAVNGRRTGIGITAEGDMIAALGLTYGTKKATEFAVKIHKTLAINAYKGSCELAKTRGSFGDWDYELEKNNPFIKRLCVADPELGEMLKEGRRNIALLTIAPTGTVSLMTQTTSGIEPVFLPAYKRRRKINPNDKDVRVDFVDENGDSWEEYAVFHHGFLSWLVLNDYDVQEVMVLPQVEIDKIVEKSPYHKATSNDVDWVEKVRMQGAVQKWVDHSISVTVNLPNDATEEVVSQVYKTAWETGCKGVTVYRDGSRSGVLVSNDKKEEIEEIYESHAPRRPKVIECDILRFQNNKEKWIGFVGTIENRPYEIFTGLLESFQIPTFVESGWVKKVKETKKDEDGKEYKASRYDFVYVDKDGYEQEMRGLSRAFEREFWNYGKLMSGILRHGMPIPHVLNLIDSLSLRGDSIVSWKSGVKRMLKKYIKEGEVVTGQVCPECGNKNLRFESGCVQCPKCGWSKCS